MHWRAEKKNLLFTLFVSITNKEWRNFSSRKRRGVIFWNRKLYQSLIISALYFGVEGKAGRKSGKNATPTQKFSTSFKFFFWYGSLECHVNCHKLSFYVPLSSGYSYFQLFIHLVKNFFFSSCCSFFRILHVVLMKSH